MTEIDVPEPEHPGKQSLCTPLPTKRVVRVMGLGGNPATIECVVRRGDIWMSIEPAFTWWAIMKPDKAEEFIRVLHQSVREARPRPPGV